MIIAQRSDADAANDALTAAGVPREPPEGDDERAAGLALGALSPPELLGLRLALEELEERLRIRADPFAEDLEDGDPAAELEALARAYAPALAACRALGARRRAAPEGVPVVAIAMECGATVPGVTCVPLWRPTPPSRSTERARFFEWPLAGAVVLGFADSRDADAARSVLRARSRDRASAVALAITEADLAGRVGPEIAEVQAAAGRALAQARRFPGADTRLLERLARAPVRPSRRVPWLALDPEELLVIPRLGALANMAAFVAEVEGIARALPVRGPIEWVRRPEPIR